MCCPPNSTCHHSSRTPSRILCCPHGRTCGPDASAHCPLHTFQCPGFVGGGCCLVGLRCSLDLCQVFSYKTLAVYKPLQISENLMSKPSGSDQSTAPTSSANPQDVLLQAESNMGLTATTCTLPSCQSASFEEGPLNLLTSDRIRGKSTAFRAKVGETAVRNEADDGLDGKDGRRRLIRLTCTTAGMAFITLLMMVL